MTNKFEVGQEYRVSIGFGVFTTFVITKKTACFVTCDTIDEIDGQSFSPSEKRVKIRFDSVGNEYFFTGFGRTVYAVASETLETPSQTTTEVTVTTEEIATETVSNCKDANRMKEFYETVQNHAETTIEVNEESKPIESTTEPDKSLKTAGIGVYAKIYDTATGLIVEIKNEDFGISTHCRVESVHVFPVVQKDGLRYYHLAMTDLDGSLVGKANVDSFETDGNKALGYVIDHDHH